MATVLMAIARKVIVLDFTKTEPSYVYAMGVVIIAMSIGYWLVCILPGTGSKHTLSDILSKAKDEKVADG